MSNAAVNKECHVMNVFKGQLVAGGFGTLILGALAFSASAATQGAMTPSSIAVMDQKIDDGQLTVEYAYLPNKGYAVIYGADKDGNPIREPLGHLALEQGSHLKFKIKLNDIPPAGSQLWVSLYEDRDNKAGFDKQADASIWGDELPAENKVLVQ
jgi:hypothetical protein